MSKRSLIVGVALAIALAGLPPAGAQMLEIIAQENDESPETSFFFKRFDEVDVSDAAGERVAVHARLGAKKCIFALNPALTPDMGSTIVCKGDLTPHIPPGRAFRRLQGPSINLTSDVAFPSRVSGGDGVFRRGPAIIAVLGDPVPAPGSGLLKNFPSASLTDTVGVFFAATISGGAVVPTPSGSVVADEGVFRCSGGNGNCSAANGGTGVLTTVALVGHSVPDRANREFCGFGKVSAGTFGVAFQAATKLDCADNSEATADGVFRAPVAGAIVTVALETEPSNPFPGPGGTTYASILTAPSIANSGMVTFGAQTAGVIFQRVVYLCDPVTCPAAPATAAVTAGQVDDDGNAFRTFSRSDVSDVGDVAFSAKVTPPTGGTRDGLYIREIGGDIVTVALAGQPVPGAPAGSVFMGLLPPAMSNGGKVAFSGRYKTLTGTPRKPRALFIYE
jgi:hypothetical protein